MNCLPLFACKDSLSAFEILPQDNPAVMLFNSGKADIDKVLTFMQEDSRFLAVDDAQRTHDTTVALTPSKIDDPILDEFNKYAVLAQSFVASSYISVKHNKSYNKENIDFKSTTIDFITYMLILELWKYNKQIYTVHSVLEEDFLKFDTVEFPVSILDRLPYNTFYVEFDDSSEFKKHFDGAFVHVIKYKTGYEVHLVRLNSDTEFMSGTFSLQPGDDGIVIFDKKVDAPYDRTCELLVDWDDFGVFILNTLLYLCAANSEITESEVTKRTYRPSKTIKNKFSEVRKYECGFVYGKSVRLHKEMKANSVPNRGNGKVGVPKRPHTRRAHWHHYRVGPGKKEVILKWVAPMYIRKDEECIATKHRVIR